MMWFSRKEFDRNAWFYTDADVRGGLHWKALCDMTLPVPHIDKQKEIVKEYNTIIDRIKLNNQLIQKLEETAQAVYKQWFVDFEFPFVFASESAAIEGMPYKSNGGEMVESEFGEIPLGWKVGELQDIIIFKNGKTKPSSIGKYAVFGGNGIIEYIDDFNDENIIAIGRVGAYCGSLFRVLGKCWISDNAISAKSREHFNMFCFYTLKKLKLNERSEGTGQPLLTQGLLNAIKIIIPNNELMSKFEKAVNILFINSNFIEQELDLMENLRNTVLSKLATMKN